MALVNIDDAGDSGGWSKRNRQKTKHKSKYLYDDQVINFATHVCITSINLVILIGLLLKLSILGRPTY